MFHVNGFDDLRQEKAISTPCVCIPYDGFHSTEETAIDANNDLLSYFEDLPDPRVVGCCDHKLLDIVAITVCAVISGLDEWEDIVDYFRMRSWFRHFLELPKGIPSHDTFVVGGSGYENKKPR